MEKSPEHTLNIKDYLKSLLLERIAEPERKEEIDNQIRQRFEREVAIMVLDLCGFSRTTIKYGIIHFLSLIVETETLASPVIKQHSGTLIKQDADNLFAVFPTPAQAIDASVEIINTLRDFDAKRAIDSEIYGCIGIGFGPTLLIDGEDLFGNEMNLASKLGEDLAESMEILLTESAAAALPDGHYPLEPLTYNISGLELKCFRLKVAPD
ncbi:MAG: putative adenylate/guanylate cyclase [Chloroflexi bacterium]|nr:putative adenylate/guanylate cyclase [Chloroflexota bacterium]